MSGLKPFASLSSALLARKGQARPAMRPYGFAPEGGYDDLGWNDMGTAPGGVAEAPAVHRQQADIAEGLGISREEAEAPIVRLAVKPERATTPALREMTPAKGRIAFTLRLDPDRHARLRAACAREQRSGQAIVTEALDAFLADVEAAGRRKR